MSTIAELNQRIKIANAESKRLNNERQVNIGKRETLTQQLNEALSKYKADYGVELTEETLEAEIQRVIAVKEEEITAIEQMLALIQQGNFAEALKLAGVEPSEAVATETVESPATPVVDTPPVAQTVETPIAPATPVAPQPVSPATPVAETPIAPATPIAPQTPTQPLQGVESLMNAPTPPSVATPEPTQKPEQSIQSFQAILGGTPFATGQ